jgi:thioredoxin-dependent peroxiredoxin
MSKKTRKKSPKPAAGKTIRARPARTAKAPSKARKATAARSGESAKKKQTGNPTAKASHKAPSKKLKSSSPEKSASPAIAAPKAAAAKRVVAPVRKLPVDKAGGSPAPRPTPSAPVSGPLTEGAKAPAFSLPRDGGGTVSLKDYAGQKLVLFFYPRADTPGCTKEAIDFTRLTSAFADTRTAVLGVSADPLKAQEAFRNKHQLSTPLVSDEQHEMLEAYGVWGEKSMYGRTFQGILRTTVLIGGDGRVIRIWRHVKVDGHADEVLAAARAG